MSALRRYLPALILGAMLASAGARLQAQSQITPLNRPRVGNIVLADKFDWSGLAATATPPGPGAVVITPQQAAVELSDGTPFHPFITPLPVRITDSAGGTETLSVTPQACGGTGPCALAATFASAHPGALKLSSGSDGLQEAIADAAAGGGGIVVADDQWRGTTAEISAAQLPGNVLLEVQRSGTLQLYGANPLNGSPSLIWSTASGQVSVGTLNSSHPALTPTSIEGVEYADQFAGIDIGAQVNAAGAQCPDNGVSGCTIVVPASAAGQSFGTTITLNKYNESLECPTGTVLYYTGGGDGILVAQGALGPSFTSGHLDGCIIDGSQDSHPGVNGVRQVNTTGFAYGRGFSVQNFSAAGDTGLLWQNQPTSYTDGGVCTHCVDGSQNERTYIQEARSSDNTIDFELQTVSGGGNSFEYSKILGLHLQVGNGQTGLQIVGDGTNFSASLLQSMVDIFANTADPVTPATLIRVENGGAMYNNAYAFINEETLGSQQIPYVVADTKSYLDFSGFGTAQLSGGGAGVNFGTFVPPMTVGNFTIPAGQSVINNGTINGGLVNAANLEQGAQPVALSGANGVSAGTISITGAIGGTATFQTPYAAAPVCVASPAGTTAPTTALSYAVQATASGVSITLGGSGTFLFSYLCFPASNP